jgi:hypothetical protein
LKTLEDGAVGFVSLLRRLGRFAAREVSDDVGVDTHERHPENGLSLSVCLSTSAAWEMPRAARRRSLPVGSTFAACESVHAGAGRSGLVPLNDGFRHEAFLYADHSEFLAGTAAFTGDAVTAGEPILVVVDGARSPRCEPSWMVMPSGCSSPTWRQWDVTRPASSRRGRPSSTSTAPTVNAYGA